jgi:RNA methyltransferase, TrmH family
MRSHYPASQLISSRNHPAIKQVRALQNRANRDASGVFVAEGVRFFVQAVESRCSIQKLVIAPDLLVSPVARKHAHRLERGGAQCLRVTAEVFQSLATTDAPQGIAAVVRQDWTTPSGMRPEEGLCWIALSTVQSAGNLGTLIRTADAVGAAGLVFLNSGPDPYEPACVRATMGAVFSLRFVRASLSQLISWKRAHRAALVGTSPGAGIDYQTPYSDPVVLFLGEERKGMSEDEIRACDLMVRIPMVGTSDSLNLGVAGSLLLYELFNQRRRPLAP